MRYILVLEDLPRKMTAEQLLDAVGVYGPVVWTEVVQEPHGGLLGLVEMAEPDGAEEAQRGLHGLTIGNHTIRAVISLRGTA